MANYGKCTVCGYKGNRDKDDRCYRPECKKARAKAAAATAPAQGTPGGGGLTAENAPLEIVHEAEKTRENNETRVAACPDYSGESTQMVPDLPEDLDRPFSLAGIQFSPLHKRRQTGENSVTIRTKSMGISTTAEAEFGLKHYTHARYTVSLDGTAIAIKFLTERRPGALCVNRSTGSMSISAQPLASKHPNLVGKKGRLEATDVRDWFVVRFGGEAA